MNRKDIFFLILINGIYLTILFIFHSQIFTYYFNTSLIDQYLRSQDITHDVAGRVFLSDSEIHEAAGYLYATGEDPTKYNFQHPPFIKYLYGFSILVFKNPYIVQMLSGILLLIGTYYLGKILFKSTLIAVISSLLIVIDPLFIELSSSLLLDLGQTSLVIFYIICFLWYRSNWLLQGIILGLLAGSKFWGGTTLFIIAILLFYAFIKKKLEYKSLILHLIVAGVIFCLLYLKTFIQQNGLFNIIFYEMKTLKYWFDHSVTSLFGASFILFASGYVTTWWGNQETIKVAGWSPLWPVTLALSIYKVIAYIKNKKIDEVLLISAIPLLYLLYLGIQAPFTRYFIVILPFLYVSSTAIIVNKFKGRFK